MYSPFSVTDIHTYRTKLLPHPVFSVAESLSHAIPPSTSSLLDVAANGAVLVHLVSPRTHTGRVKLLWHAIVAALVVDALHLWILLRLVVFRADSWRR
jgi:hypothetical protein